MKYWIFTTTSHKTNQGYLEARDIFNQRTSDSFWGLGEKTPNRNSLTEGDSVVFYIGVPEKVFAATAILASCAFELDASQIQAFGHGVDFFTVKHGVLLKDIDVWGNSKPVVELLPFLQFIENKGFWYSYFQGGVRQISGEDYDSITGQQAVSIVEQIEKTKDLERQAEFALETHLEEFIANNWDKINWGTDLLLYETDEQSGRQFPAGTWSIDFLAVDQKTNDIVVIELKRGQTSDATVGQILRYMSCVEENLAEQSQEVRGIIIGREVDEALKYAAKNQDSIEIKTYEVDFKLFSYKAEWKA